MESPGYTTGKDELPTAARGSRSWFEALPFLAIGGLGGTFWLLFRPGILSADSVSQLKQALTWRFSDWHPPAMSIAIATVFELGGSLASITLAQCLAAVFGMAFLVAGVLDTVAPSFHPERRWWAAVAVLVILLLPWSPFGFYTMTLWKDSWAAVMLLWIAVALLRLRDPRAPEWVAAAALALGALLGLVRHNAIVVLPVLGLLVALALRRRGASRWVVCLPLILPLASISIGTAIDDVFSVRRLHPSSQVMALDLTGLCAASSAWCQELPFTRKYIRSPDLAKVYQPGNIGSIFWSTPPAVDRLIMLENYPALTAEYVHALEHHPLALVRIKLEAASELLGLEETYYPFHSSVGKNPWRMGFDPRFAEPRALFISEAGKWLGASARRWLWGVHAVWLGVGVGLLIALVAQRKRWAAAATLAGILAIALAYAASYLAAVPVHDFRFLYPATLLIQGVALALLWSALAHIPRGRVP